MSQLTTEILEFLPPHTVLATGVTTDDAEGCNMTGNGQKLRWVAKRGYVHDWCIYIHTEDKSVEWIIQSGDKVCSKDNIRKLVPCTEEALNLYRF